MSTIVVHQEELSTLVLQQTSACQLAPLVLCQHQQTRSLRRESAVDGIRSAHPKLLNGESYLKHNMLTLSQVQAKDDCGKLSIAYSITLSDFLFLNPEVYSNCTNLLLGVAYCVFPVGNIATYSGYKAPPTISITVPPATFSPVNTANPSTTNYPNPGYRFQQLPMASGTAQGCASYANYNDNTTDGRFNSCSYVAYAYGVDFSDLLTWNPSLSKNETDCAFQPGYSYCVQKTNSTAYVPSNSNCVSVNATEIQGGTASNCVCFTEVSGYDGTVGVNCASVAEDASIKLSQLTTWNSWLGSACDTALFANLDENDFRAVCIGVNSTAHTATATNPPSTASTPTGTKSSASMGALRLDESARDHELTRS